MTEAPLPSVSLRIALDLSRALHVRLSGQDEDLYRPFRESRGETRSCDCEAEKSKESALHDEFFYAWLRGKLPLFLRNRSLYSTTIPLS